MSPDPRILTILSEVVVRALDRKTRGCALKYNIRRPFQNRSVAGRRLRGYSGEMAKSGALCTSMLRKGGFSHEKPLKLFQEQPC